MQVQAQGHGCEHKDMDMSIGTQMWADWKCEHKNKVKKAQPPLALAAPMPQRRKPGGADWWSLIFMNLTRLIAEAGRQGQPQQVWLDMIRCKLAGMSTDRHGHRDMDAGIGMQMQM